MGGRVGVRLPDIKAKSAQFQVKFPTGAELGNMVRTFFCLVWFVRVI